MRILLDENVPLPLLEDFVGHECAHVGTLGWRGVRNGQLLARSVAAGYEVLLTFDDGIPHQHDIARTGIAVYVLKPDGQGVPAARELVPEVLEALKTCYPGQVLTLSNRLKP